MKKRIPTIALGLLVGAGAIIAQDDGGDTVAKVNDERVKLVEQVYPAFVSIGGGSGVCISPDGYFVTNHHVWNEAAAPAVQLVTMAGNTMRFTADAVGADPRGDIVLGKIRLEEGHTVPHVPLADSEEVQIGDLCLSIGNPFMLAGFDNEPTVTWGTVTAKNRFQGGYNDSLQIDTAINPGNSGGPTFNIDGEVIGINGRNIASHRQRFNTGAGYAIPSSQVKNFLDALKAQEGGALLVRHGIVGGLEFDMGSQDGAKITAVDEESEAGDAGFQRGDVIRKMDGKEVFNSYRYYGIVGTKPRGSAFEFVVERNGEEVTLFARNNVPTEAGQFGTVPRTSDQEKDGDGNNPFGSLNPFALPNMKSGMGFRGRPNDDREVGGYIITGITNESLAEAGLKEGDILTHINGRHIWYHSDVKDILIALDPGTEVSVTWRRDGEEMKGTAETTEP